VIWRAKFNQQTFRSSRSQSHGAFDGFDAIALAQNNNTRLPIFRFFFADAGKVHNGQQIAFLAQIRDGAVQNDFAGAALAANGVGLKALAVGHVAAENFFIFLQAAFSHEVGGNGEAAFVLNVAAGHRGAVDF